MRKYHKYFPDGENRIGCRVSFLDHVGQLAVGFADVLSPGGGLVLPVDDFGLRHCFGPSDEPEKQVTRPPTSTRSINALRNSRRERQALS